MTDIRRHISPILGLVEVVLAASLFLLGLALPARDDLRPGFDGTRRITSAAGDQVRALPDQVAELRQSWLRQAADPLGAAIQTMTTVLRATRLDFDSVRTIRDTMGRTAEGLDGIAGALNPVVLDGLGATADYLDLEVVPAAARAADGLDLASGRLQAGVGSHARIARQSSPDLKPLRDVHDGLARLDEGLGSLQAALDPRRLAALRQAIAGAEEVVAEAARMADRAAGYPCPVVTMDGLKPGVGSRPFWTRGKEVGTEMRQVSGGVGAMWKEVGALAEELPKVQAAGDEGGRATPRGGRWPSAIPDGPPLGPRELARGPGWSRRLGRPAALRRNQMDRARDHRREYEAA